MTVRCSEMISANDELDLLPKLILINLLGVPLIKNRF